MLKKLLRTGQAGTKETAKELLTLEISEIGEIAEKLFTRLDEKINTLKSIEALADEKIGILEKLLLRVENINLPADYGTDFRHREIDALAKKGLKVDEIASILDMPRGEVELILSLSR